MRQPRCAAATRFPADTPARWYPRHIVKGAWESPRWRSVVAMAIIAAASAMWVLVIGGHTQTRPDIVASDPHTLSTSVGADVTISADHQYLADGGSSGLHPETLAAAVLPNLSSLALTALGVVVAVVAATAWLVQRLMLAGRGPPRGFLAAVTGQDLLTRFCLSRR